MEFVLIKSQKKWFTPPYGLKNEKVHLKHEIREALEQNKILDERIENRTNRQLRKTLIFKGIPEKTVDNSSSVKESWKDTEQILADKLSEICDIPPAQADKLVERYHRANPNPKYKGSGPRPIFTAFYDWKDCELVKTDFRKNNMNNPSCHIYAEQKFGPKTTMRRNMAMIMRKELKNENEIVNGYVAYPARLMVKTSTIKGAKYICKKDFSKEEVIFNR